MIIRLLSEILRRLKRYRFEVGEARKKEAVSGTRLRGAKRLQIG
jgi:hypothetical protein